MKKIIVLLALVLEFTNVFSQRSTNIVCGDSLNLSFSNPKIAIHLSNFQGPIQILNYTPINDYVFHGIDDSIFINLWPIMYNNPVFVNWDWNLTLDTTIYLSPGIYYIMKTPSGNSSINIESNFKSQFGGDVLILKNDSLYNDSLNQNNNIFFSLNYKFTTDVHLRTYFKDNPNYNFIYPYVSNDLNKSPDTLIYHWSTNETTANIKVNPASTTNYKLKILSKNNTLLLSDSIKVIVGPLTIMVTDTVVPCGNYAHLVAHTNRSSDLLFDWKNLSTGEVSHDRDLFTLTNTKEQIYSVSVSTNKCTSAVDTIKVIASTIDFSPSICTVTVNDSNKNEIVWEKNTNPGIESYYIYKNGEGNTTGQYDSIGSVLNKMEGIFIDTLSDPNKMTYKYRLVVKDVCGNTTEPGPEVTTMFLYSNDNFLYWNSYKGVAISKYTILKGSTSLSLDPLTVDIIPGDRCEYNPFDNMDTTSGYYQVEAEMTTPCSNLKSTSFSTSRSNITYRKAIQTDVSKNVINQTSFIYPNPATDVLNIKTSIPSNATLTIYDIQGKQVLSKPVESGQVNISELTTGVYVAKVIVSNNIFINKFVKQ